MSDIEPSWPSYFKVLPALPDWLQDCQVIFVFHLLLHYKFSFEKVLLIKYMYLEKKHNSSKQTGLKIILHMYKGMHSLQ